MSAPRVAGWEPDTDAFTVTPVDSTGARGTPIHLLALFQAYDAAVSEIEDRDIADASRVARIDAEYAAAAERRDRFR